MDSLSDFLRDGSMSRAPSFVSNVSGRDEPISPPSSPSPLRLHHSQAQDHSQLHLFSASHLIRPHFAPHQSSMSGGLPSSPLPMPGTPSFHRIHSTQAPANPSFYPNSPLIIPERLPTPPSDDPIAPGLLCRSSTQDTALTRPWDPDGDTQPTESSISTSTSTANDMGGYNFSHTFTSLPRRQSSQRSTTSQDSYSNNTLRETYVQRQQGAERTYAFAHNSSLGPHTSHDQPGPFVAVNLPRANSGPRPTISPQELTSAVVTSEADNELALNNPTSTRFLAVPFSRTSSSQILEESDHALSSSAGSSSQSQFPDSPSYTVLQRRHSSIALGRSSSSQSRYGSSLRLPLNPFYPNPSSSLSVAQSSSTRNDNVSTTRRKALPTCIVVANPTVPSFGSLQSTLTPVKKSRQRPLVDRSNREKEDEVMSDSTPTCSAAPFTSQKSISEERSTRQESSRPTASVSSSPLSSVSPPGSEGDERRDAVKALLSLSQDNGEQRSTHQEVADQRQVRAWRRRSLKQLLFEDEAPGASPTSTRKRQSDEESDDENLELHHELKKFQKNNNGARTLRSVHFANMEAESNNSAAATSHAASSAKMLPAALLYSHTGRITRAAAAHKSRTPFPNSNNTTPSSELSTLPSSSSSNSSRQSARTKATRTARNATPRSESPAREHVPSPANVAQVAPTPYQRREFPASLPIKEGFEGWYRRYRVPSTLPHDVAIEVFGGTTPASFHTDIKDVAKRGMRTLGTRNELEPHVLNLYTPRFVKGRALCVICYEEGNTRWFKTKVSAYNYHMQNAHGISSSTGEPLDPPIAFSSTTRSAHGVGEKSELLTGKCHACQRFVELEGPKQGTVKVPEIYWWKHAAACHRNKAKLEGTGGIYIEDALYQRIKAWVDAQPDSEDDAEGEADIELATAGTTQDA